MALVAGYGPALAAVYQKSNVIRTEDPSLHLHPDFLVRRFEVNKPFAATIIEADITPDAAPEEVEMAWDFNLGCITRWGGCRSVDEMKPESATRGNPVSPPGDYKFRYCSVKHLGRDSETAALMTIKAVEPCCEPRGSPAGQIVHFQVDELLSHRVEAQADLRRLRLPVRQGSLTSDPVRRRLSRELFAPGRQVLLFGRYESLLIDPDCGVMPADPEILEHVRAAIAKAQPR